MGMSQCAFVDEGLQSAKALMSDAFLGSSANLLTGGDRVSAKQL
jgi:hypothetical protein